MGMRFVSIALSFSVGFMNIDATHAAPANTVSPHGLASTLKLKVPLGGGTRTDSRPTLALGVGPSWRLESDTPSLSSYRYAPTLEAGMTFAGDPFLHVGSIDMLRQGQQPRANISPAQDSQNTVWMWILGGVAVVAVLSAVAANNNGSNIPGCDPRYYTYDPKRGTCVLDPSKPGAFQPPPQPNPFQ